MNRYPVTGHPSSPAALYIWISDPCAQLEAQKRFVSVSVMGRKETLVVASLEGGLSVTRPGGELVVNR